MHDLEQRVHRLETSLKRARLLALVSFALLFLICVTGWQRPLGPVVGTGWIIKDKAGKVRAEIGVGLLDKDTTFLKLSSKDGRTFSGSQVDNGSADVLVMTPDSTGHLLVAKDDPSITLTRKVKTVWTAP